MNETTEQYDTGENQYDPYQITAESVQEPPTTWGGVLRRIGPGLILTASIVGTGELIATTNLGAKAGFALLWLVILSCVIKVFVQIELGRYTLSSGDTTLASFRQVRTVGSMLSERRRLRLPKWLLDVLDALGGDLLCWWWFFMMLLTQFQIGAMIGGTAQAIHLILPDASAALNAALFDPSSTAGKFLQANPETPWAFLVTAVSILILVRGRYHVIEGFSTAMVAIFTLLTVMCVVLLPFTDPTNITPPADAGPGGTSGLWLAAFAMIGITGVGASELIAYPYWCLEKRYARYVGPPEESESWARRAKGWIRVMHADSWLSMVVYTLATVAFYVLGAAVLFEHTRGRGLSEGNTGQMLDDLARMYEPVLGRTGSLWFIALGGFMVLYSTLFAATAGNTRVTTDFLRVERLVPFRPVEYRNRWIRVFSWGLPLFGLLLFLFVGSPVSMVIIGGVAQAVTLPLIAAVAIFLRWRRTDRRLVTVGVWDVMLWLSLLMFTFAAGWGIWNEIRKML